MGLGFQIVLEDIIQAVETRMFVSITEVQASKIMTKLDLDKVEKEALEAMDMDEQTEFAYIEIARQIRENDLFAGIVD